MVLNQYATTARRKLLFTALEPNIQGAKAKWDNATWHVWAIYEKGWIPCDFSTPPSSKVSCATTIGVGTHSTTRFHHANTRLLSLWTLRRMHKFCVLWSHGLAIKSDERTFVSSLATVGRFGAEKTVISVPLCSTLKPSSLNSWLRITIFKPFTFKKCSVTSGPKATPTLLLIGRSPAWIRLRIIPKHFGHETFAILVAHNLGSPFGCHPTWRCHGRIGPHAPRRPAGWWRGKEATNRRLHKRGRTWLHHSCWWPPVWSRSVRSCSLFHDCRAPGACGLETLVSMQKVSRSLPRKTILGQQSLHWTGRGSPARALHSGRKCWANHRMSVDVSADSDFTLLGNVNVYQGTRLFQHLGHVQHNLVGKLFINSRFLWCSMSCWQQSFVHLPEGYTGPL